MRGSALARRWGIAILAARADLGADLRQPFLQPGAAAVLIGGDDRQGDEIAHQPRGDAGQQSAHQIGQEDPVEEIRQPLPLRRLVGEEGHEVVVQVLEGMAEGLEQPLGLDRGEMPAKHPVAELDRDQRDQREGQRVADQRAEERGDDIAAHQPGKHHRAAKVKAEERREGDQHAREDAARDPLGPVGQAVQPVLDVVEGTGPAAARPDRLAQRLQEGTFVAPLENHRRPSPPCRGPFPPSAMPSGPLRACARCRATAPPATHPSPPRAR
ncbi:hypothetical protein SDC9_34786 [bioreactor metagenome]|uniref:Uncharacterized protein n=1 Tax=bioreactor metagenome TaxID=1076179 RepID=A0A644VBN7_9ZZZZ